MLDAAIISDLFDKHLFSLFIRLVMLTSHYNNIWHYIYNKGYLRHHKSREKEATICLKEQGAFVGEEIFEL